MDNNDAIKSKDEEKMPLSTLCRRNLIRPLIVYTCEPEVIYTDASNFMRVVQNLTGSSTSLSRTSSSSFFSTSSLCSTATAEWNQRKRRRRSLSHNHLNGFTTKSEESTISSEISAALNFISTDITEKSNDAPDNVLYASIDSRRLNSEQAHSSNSQLHPGSDQVDYQSLSSSDLIRSLSGDSSISTSCMQETDALLMPTLMSTELPLLPTSLIPSLNLNISPSSSVSMLASPGTPSISSSCSACFHSDELYESVEQDYQELLYIASNSDKEESRILPGLFGNPFSLNFLQDDIEFFG